MKILFGWSCRCSNWKPELFDDFAQLRHGRKNITHIKMRKWPLMGIYFSSYDDLLPRTYSVTQSHIWTHRFRRDMPQTWIPISVWRWFNQRQSHDNASRVCHKFASLLATSYSSKKWLQKAVRAAQIDFSLKQIDICFGWHLIISGCPNLDLFIRRQLPGPYYATRYLAVYWYSYLALPFMEVFICCAWDGINF